MIYITRRERFNAAHRLFRKDYSDEENLDVFWQSVPIPIGMGTIMNCLSPLKAMLIRQRVFLINLKDLSKLIKEKVIEKLDHKKHQP